MLWLAMTVLSLIAACCYAFFVEPRRLTFRTVTIEFDDYRLPVEKLVILHLTDLHFQRNESYKVSMFQRIAALTPDVAVITGDLIERDDGIQLCVEQISRLQAQLGIYCVLGNHDHFRSGGNFFEDIIYAAMNVIYVDRKLRNDVSALVRQLEDVGARVLRNGNTRLPVGAGEVWLIGVDDPVCQNDDLRKGMVGVPDGAFKILLSHSPELMDDAAAAGIDVVLAGHTHGGQIRVPFFGALRTRTRKPVDAASGLSRRGATWLHISPGLGGSVPLRFLCPPQATIVELKRRKPSED
ncbi:MAG: metallophosphoesterase [Dehalococcoidales bacterium]|nr:metallophosphoesterase [Dehalococcoidales bacterium]